MKKQKWLALICIALVGVFCFGFAVIPADASLEDDLAKAEKQLQQAKNDLAALEKKLAEAKADEKRQVETKILLEEQLNNINDQMDAAEQVLAELKKDLAEKNTQLILLQSQYDNAYSLYRLRVRANYEAGDQSLMEVLLTSSSLSEMMTRIDLQTQIAEYDHALMNKISAAVEQQIVLTDEVYVEIARQEEVNAEIAQLIKDQKAKIKEIDKAIEKLEANQEKYREQSDDLEDKMVELDSKILALIKSIEEYKGGELVWPIDPNYSCNVSSTFGMREKYVNGKVVSGQTSYHAAIDIAASYGTPVVATASGVITSIGWNSYGAGNQIQMDHGNNLSSIYNHMSGFAKNPKTGKKWAAGDRVEKGQVIGYVGSTGNSTGNHLDFRLVYRDSSGVNRAKAIGMGKHDYYISGSVVYLNPLCFVTKQNKKLSEFSIQEYLKN